jgi:hypothetical protein
VCGGDGMFLLLFVVVDVDVDVEFDFEKVREGSGGFVCTNKDRKVLGFCLPAFLE